MFGGGAKEQHCQPVASAIHRRVIHLPAHSFEATEVVVLAEQPLEKAALLPVGDGQDANLFQSNPSRPGRLAGRQFLSFHAADGKKFNGRCSLKSALNLPFLPQRTFMHTR